MKIKEPGKKNELIIFSLLTVLMVSVLYVGPHLLLGQSATKVYIRNEDAMEKDLPNGKITSHSHLMVDEEESWAMHVLDSMPPSGSDGVKLEDVNGDGFPDLATGFEEGGVSRIYIHPGPDKVHQVWEYVELLSPEVEDAVLVDLDDNGIFDLVTASEGSTNQLMFHWAPDDPNEFLEPSKWQTQTVPAVEGLTAWMFVVPVELAHGGKALVVGSKRKRGEEGEDKAVVGWLKPPETPRNMDGWEYHTLTEAGWIMSIEIVDMNGDQHPDILLSDRKFSTRTGVRWLENPGAEEEAFYEEWKSHTIGVDDGEPMFLSITDLNKDGLDEILVPDLYRGIRIFEQSRDKDQRWKEHLVPYPGWAGPRGKSVSAGDINLDGNLDMVVSFEEEGKVASLPYEEYMTEGKYSVIWGYFQDDPFSVNWDFNKVSGIKGRKFDLVNLVDLDGDGDLDVLTNDENEEGDGLGVIWYENPIK